MMQSDSISSLTYRDLPVHQWKNKPRQVHHSNLWDSIVREPVSNLLTGSLFAGKTTALFPGNLRLSPKKINYIYLKSLRAIGGVEFFLSNPDGEKIHCMHFSAANFKTLFENIISQLHFDRLKIEENTGLQFYNFKVSSDQKIKDLIDLNIMMHYPGLGLAALRLPLASELKTTPTEKNNPTAIICGGSAVWFSVYRPMIAFLLLNGIDVMSFNYRGYEWSEGSPSESKMYQDLVTCYEYLKQEKGVKKKNLILYASSLGLGLAAKFNEEYPITTLIIDRSFGDLGVVVESVLRDKGVNVVASKIARFGLPLIVDFRNTSRIKKSQGHIALVVDKNDSMIPESEGEKLVLSLPNRKGCQYEMILTQGYDHDGNWLTHEGYRLQLERFLLNSGLSRSTIQNFI